MAHRESDKMAKIATIVVSVSAEEHLARLETVLKKTLDTVVAVTVAVAVLLSYYYIIDNSTLLGVGIYNTANGTSDTIVYSFSSESVRAVQ